MSNELVRLYDDTKVKITAPWGAVSEQTWRVTSDEYYRSRTKGSSPKGPNGWRAPTYYHATYGIIRRARGSAAYYAVDGSLVEFQGSEYHGWYGADSPPFPNYLRKRAEVDALAQLKDQAVNLAQAYAERDQLADLVGDTASRIARSYRAARKGNFKRAANELGASWRKSTRNWLELQYAWKPLLGDIHGSVEELQGKPPKSWLVTVKAAAREPIRFDRESVTSARVPMLFHVTGFHGAFVRLDYHPSNEFMSTVTRLGLTNPLTLAWELLPFSFVVDWLWPVGDWLNVLDATIGFDFAGGSVSTITKTRLTSEPLHKMHWPAYLVKNEMVGGMGKTVFLTRTPYASSPLPRPPGLKNPASLGHMANGLSLLAEAFGRRR